MSASSSSSRAPGLLWLLAALAGFAVLANVFSALLSGERTDPRLEVRADNRAEIDKLNNETLAKVGLAKGKSDEALAKGLAYIKAQTQSTSTVVVPGSPTQLKQAAEAAKAAPAPAPAAPAAPAPAPAK